MSITTYAALLAEMPDAELMAADLGNVNYSNCSQSTYNKLKQRISGIFGTWYPYRMEVSADMPNPGGKDFIILKGTGVYPACSGEYESPVPDIQIRVVFGSLKYAGANIIMTFPSVKDAIMFMESMNLNISYRIYGDKLRDMASNIAPGRLPGGPRIKIASRLAGAIIAYMQRVYAKYQE